MLKTLLQQLNIALKISFWSRATKSSWKVIELIKIAWGIPRCMQFWILQIEIRFMIKREAFSNKIKQLTYSFLYAHFSFLQTKISKIAQTTRGNRRIYLIKAKPQICSDLQGNKMCLPSKSLPKLRLIYILWRMSSLHKSFPFYM